MNSGGYILDDLPAGLSKPAQRALAAAGITRLSQCTKLRKAEVASLHGIGPKALAELQSALAAQGLSFAVEGTKVPVIADDDRIYDSPTQWINAHIREYVETNGAKGHEWRGMQTLLLTTTGRKTGKKRRTALIYGQDGPNYVVVASNGGSSMHPQWYLNLLINPQVTVQVGADVLTAHASAASQETRPRLWKLMADIFPQYERYREGTQRDIPVVILTPTHV